MLVWGWLLEKRRGANPKSKIQASSLSNLEDGHDRGPHCGGASVRRLENLINLGGVTMRARNPIVIHYVSDMDRAKAFYTRAFDVKPSFESSGWTTLDFGVIQVALHILPQSDEGEGPLPHAGLNLEVDNIEEIQADIESLGGKLIELREPHGGVPVRVATFRDSEGNGFELRQKP
jgi:predicted enzyme related to lactoylglutathione lyase